MANPLEPQIKALEESLAAARLAARISGNKNSYRRDNPGEYAKVIAYLDGGPRPTGVATKMGQHLVLEEDVRIALVKYQPIPPSTGGDFGDSLPARMIESTGALRYVRTDGSDSNAGTAYTAGGAWLTIQKALDTLTAGQICKVGPGSYSKAGRFDCSNNLGGPEPATLEAYDTADRPVLTRQLDVQYDNVSQAGAYWRFRNLVFDGNNSGDTYGVRVTDHNLGTCPHHLEFYACEYRNVGQGSSIPQPQGMAIFGTNTSKATITHHIDVYNCWFHHINDGTDAIRSHGVYVANLADSVFANNIVYDGTGWGFRCGSGGPTSMSVRDCFFVNNTFHGSTLAGGIILFEDAAGTPPQYLSGGNLIYNNIASDCPSQPGFMSNFSSVDGPADEFNLFDANIAYQTNGTHTNISGADISSTFVNNPVNSDPLFVNEGTRDFHLQGGSPAIGAGLADYTPTFDFDGLTRTTADLGAYRYA